MQNITTQEHLFNLYGPIMSLVEVAIVLKYPTKDAVRKAIVRGSLPIDPVKIPNRKEIFIKTSDVARYLESVTSS